MSSKLSFLLFWNTLFCLWVAMRVQGDAIRAQACDSETSSACLAMVGYKAVGNFDLFLIAARFSVNDSASVLGPNDIDPSLWGLSDLVLPPQEKPYLIPKGCGCVGGTRVVTWVNYTVVGGDTLSAIAASYLNLVNYTEIAEASSIPNPDMIQIGQQIVIPIPCACFNQTSALSLSYQVQPGDSLSGIAKLYNTSAAQLQDLNSLANASDELEAQKVLFVPLPVCKANFSKGATDGNLTVVEGTYELTANGCVQCSCNEGILHCIPASPSFGRTCSNLTCTTSKLQLGASNASQESQECSVESCVYKGYTNQSGIMAVLETEQDRTCPGAPPPETFYKPPTGLVAAPLNSPPASSSTLSPPPSPPTSIAIPPSINTNPNIAFPLLGGISFFARGCLLIFWLSICVYT